MQRDLSKRIAKLEGRGFSPRTIRAAYIDFVEAGVVPPNPKLARIVADLKQTLIEMDATVPSAPQVSA